MTSYDLSLQYNLKSEDSRNVGLCEITGRVEMGGRVLVSRYGGAYSTKLDLKSHYVSPPLEFVFDGFLRQEYSFLDALIYSQSNKWTDIRMQGRITLDGSYRLKVMPLSFKINAPGTNISEEINNIARARRREFEERGTGELQITRELPWWSRLFGKKVA